MSVYLDTSAVVSALTREAPTQWVQNWIADRSPGEILISDWVTAEVSSALSMKVRMGVLRIQEQGAALASFRRQFLEKVTILPVTAGHFHQAARYADRHDLGLRASDALHLAVAAEHRATLFTLDRRMYAAARSLGHLVETV